MSVHLYIWAMMSIIMGIVHAGTHALRSTSKLTLLTCITPIILKSDVPYALSTCM